MPTLHNVVRTLLVMAIPVALFVAMPGPASAQEPMDFSDADQKLVDWPFTVVEYWVEDDGMNVWQHTRVSESPEQVFETLRDMKRDRQNLGPFVIRGAAKKAEPRNFEITFFRNNTRYSVQIKPDGAGSDLVVKSTPNAIRSAFFKRAIYGYRLGEGLSVPCERFDNRDE